MPDSPLQSKAERAAGLAGCRQEGRVPEGCLGSASRQAPSTAGAPAQLHATICTPQHPLRQGCAHGCCFPHPWRPPPPNQTRGGLGVQGAPLTFNDAPLGLAAQHSLAVHLVLLVRSHHGEGDLLLPAQRSVLTRGAAGLLQGPPLPHRGPQEPAFPIPASRHSPESCRSAAGRLGPGRSPPVGTR